MLGSIQGFVGTFQESFRISPVGGCKGNPDASAGADLDIVDHKRHIEAGDNSVCESHGRPGVVAFVAITANSSPLNRETKSMSLAQSLSRWPT